MKTTYSKKSKAMEVLEEIGVDKKGYIIYRTPDGKIYKDISGGCGEIELFSTRTNSVRDVPFTPEFGTKVFQIDGQPFVCVGHVDYGKIAELVVGSNTCSCPPAQTLPDIDMGDFKIRITFGSDCTDMQGYWDGADWLLMVDFPESLTAQILYNGKECCSNIDAKKLYSFLYLKEFENRH